MNATLRQLTLTLLLFAGAASHAASAVYLVSPQVEVGTGDVVGLQVWITFTDEPTIGGGIDVNWDPLALQLQVSDFFSVGDPQYFQAPEVTDGSLFDWGVFDFGGISGTHHLGTLQFTVLESMGVSTSILAAETTGGYGPFVDSLGDPIYGVVYGGTTLTRIPLPGAFGLLLGAIALAGAGLREGSGTKLRTQVERIG